MTKQAGRRSGLGRGLASLIPTGPADGESNEISPRMGDAAADVVLGGGNSSDSYRAGRGRRRRRLSRDRPVGDRTEPPPAPAGVRRGGAGRTRPLDPRVRTDAADRRACGRRCARRAALPARHGGAAVARGSTGRPGGHPRDRPRDRRRQHVARRAAREHPPRAAESRWKRPPPTNSCSTSSASRTTSSPPGSVGRARSSPT